MKPPDPKTVCLNKWLLFVMNMIQGDHMNRHIHVESEVLHSIYNRLHPEFMYEMKGMFVRSIKRMIKKNKWRDIQVSTEERNKVHSKRQIYFNFLHVNNSDKKYTSQIVISDSNDEYIPIFFNNLGETSSINTKKQPIDPLMTPTTPPTVTLEKSTISVPPLTHPKFPLLFSLGVKPNFESAENSQIIKNLLAEIVRLHSDSNKDLAFHHVGNNKPAILVSIPKANNYATFEKNERKQKWLESIITFVSQNNKNTNTSPSVVCSWLLRDLYKYYPEEFISSAINNGLHVVHKMNAIEAAAMWIDANISFCAAKTIVKHLYQKFKFSIQVPFSQIHLLGDVTKDIEPVFEEFVLKKTKCEGEVEEKIKYWYYDISNLLEIDYDRFVKSQFDKNEYKIEYGYKYYTQNGEKMGVYLIIGSDHGAGKSRYLLRTLFCNSESRRQHGNKVDYGTRTVQFAEVDCKKDVVEVQSKIAPCINCAIEKIEKSKLVGIQNEINEIKCVFVAKNATNIRTIFENHILYLTYEDENANRYKRKLNMSNAQIKEIWTIIPSFKFVVAGDLSFFASSSGRDGRSHCRCTYCPLSATEWKDSSTAVPNNLTLATINNYANIYNQHKAKKTKLKPPDTKGIIMNPLLNIEPTDYIVPLLHLLIGIVNKAWISFLFFLDEFVENVGEIESNLKDRLHEIQKSLKYINEEMELHTVNKNMALMEKRTDAEAQELYEYSIKSFDDLKIKKKTLVSEMRDVKRNIEIEKKTIR